jgi:hypothetical protein
MQNTKIFQMSFASVYPYYLTKAERKGRSKAEVDTIISRLTGYNQAQLQVHLDNQTTFEQFFAQAQLNLNVDKITGVICGYRIEDIPDPLMKQIRYLDKLIDELAKGRPMDKILRH